MSFYDSPIAQEHFLWVLGSVSRIHKVPFDPRLVLHQVSPPFTLAKLLSVAAELGIEAKLHETDPVSLANRDLPCLVMEASTDPQEAAPESKANASDGDDDASETVPYTPALLARIDAEKVLYFSAGTDQPQTEPTASFAPRCQPFAVVFHPKEVAQPADELDSKPARFGFRWFIPELLRYKRIWREVLLASLAIQIIGLTTPLFTQVVIDKVIVHQTMNTLAVVAVALFMFTVFGAAMTWVRKYLVLHTGNRIDAVLGERVFRHMFELPLRYFDSRPTGTLIARVHGVETIREFIAGAAVTLILDLPFLIIFMAVMFYYSWQLTLIVLGILATIAVLSLAVTPTLRQRLNDQFQLGARNQAFLTEYVNGMETVKSLQMEPQLREKFGDFLASYLGASFRSRQLSNSYNVAANTLEQIQTLAVLGVGAWVVMSNTGFTIGMLVAFQMFASRLAQPVLRMVGLWLQFQQADIAVKRLGDVLNAPTEPYSVTPSRAPGGEGRIEIEDLSFRYSEEHLYLYRGFNLQVTAGSMVAVMGPSGSGKSTLTKLLQGFYQPNDGRILVDGHDIRHLSANELRANFGVVPQETMLFSGTVYENLLMANPHASFEQIVQACRLAEIHTTIERLPKGYQTVLGEHGTGLSGGQRQRIAIARALLKRPKILIFDEAVSHLDSATADHFAKTVNSLKGKVTMLFITHQLPKGLKTDDVVIIGSHEGGTELPGVTDPVECQGVV